MNQNVPLRQSCPRRIEPPELIDCNWLGRNWVCFVFSPLPQRDVVLRGLPHHRRWVKYLPRTVKWLQARNRAHAAGPRPDEGVKKCWDSQPAAESSLGMGTGTQDGSTFGGPTGKTPAVFVARTRFAWLPVPIRASRTPLVTVPDFFTPSNPRTSRKSLIKRPVRAWPFGQSPVFSQTLWALALSGARRRPLHDSYPVQPAENSRTRRRNDTPAAR